MPWSTVQVCVHLHAKLVLRWATTHCMPWLADDVEDEHTREALREVRAALRIVNAAVATSYSGRAGRFMQEGARDLTMPKPTVKDVDTFVVSEDDDIACAYVLSDHEADTREVVAYYGNISKLYKRVKGKHHGALAIRLIRPPAALIILLR